MVNAATAGKPRKKERNEERQVRIAELVSIYQDTTRSKTERDTALATIMDENENWVYYFVTHNFHFSQQYLDDLVQAGRIGLLEAIQTYDPTSGYTLGTYSGKFVLHEVVTALAQIQGISPHTASRIKRYNTAAQKAIAAADDKNAWTRPTDRDIAVYANLPIKAVTTAATAKQGTRAISLNQTVTNDDDDGRELHEMLPSSIGLPETEVQRKEECRAVWEALECLKTDEKMAIIFFFNLDGHGKKDMRSLKQVAVKMKCDPSKVKDCLTSARHKLEANEKLRMMFSIHPQAPEEEFEMIPTAPLDYVEQEMALLDEADAI